MLSCDVLLRHFRKRMFQGGICSCALLPLMYSWVKHIHACHMLLDLHWKLCTFYVVVKC